MHDLFFCALNYCKNISSNIRVDTHADNTRKKTMVPDTINLQIGAIAPCGELGHLLVNEALFFLRDVKLHLDISFSICHAQPPFFIRVWDYPNKHFSFSGKGPENPKNPQAGTRLLCLLSLS